MTMRRGDDDGSRVLGGWSQAATLGIWETVFFKLRLTYRRTGQAVGSVQ
jgi:hypothetical protein